MGNRLPGGASRWLSALARYRVPWYRMPWSRIRWYRMRWYRVPGCRMPRYAGNGARLLLLAGGAGLLALAGGTLALLPHQTGHAPRDVADDCGIVTCTATLPASVTGKATLSASPSAAPRRAANTSPAAAPTRPAATRATSRPPAPTQVPAASPSPSSARPAAAVSVTVTYSVGRWFQGIQGRFVIVNNGPAAVTGWNLTVAFPGDGNFRVWNGLGRVSGATLTITAPPGAPVLAPGASQQVTIFAEGGTTEPASCTFDGAAVCHAQQHWGPGR
jgi:Cellulose binding domain